MDFNRSSRGMGPGSGAGILGPPPNMMNSNLGMQPRPRMMGNFGGPQGMGSSNMMGSGNMNPMQMTNMRQSSMGPMGGNMPPGPSQMRMTMRGNMPLSTSGPDEQLAMATNFLKGYSGAPQQQQLMNYQGGYSNRNAGRLNISMSQLGKRSSGYGSGPDIKRRRDIKPIIDQRRNFGRGDYQERRYRSQDRDSYVSHKEGRSHGYRHDSDDRSVSESDDNSKESEEQTDDDDLKDSALTVTVRSDERGRSVNEGPHDTEKEKEAAKETKKNFCYACNSQCLNEQTFKEHLNGKRHNMRMEQLSIITEQKCHEITGRMHIEGELRKIDGRGRNNDRRKPALFSGRDNSGSFIRSSSSLQSTKQRKKESKQKHTTKISEQLTETSLIDLSEYDVPPYNTNIPRGQTYVVPVSGFFCKLCHKFYNNEVAAKEAHCQTKDHYDRFKKVMELKKMQLKEQQATLIAQAVEAADVFAAEDEEDVDSDAENAKDSKRTTPSIEIKDEDQEEEENEEMEEMVIQDETNGFEDEELEKDEDEDENSEEARNKSNRTALKSCLRTSRK